MLRNSGYAGRTFYRRLSASRTRDPITGKKKRRIRIRPLDEWIEVPDATLAIVSTELFEAARKRLDDPERLRYGRRISTYGLAGRIRCSRCGSAMVGQTLQGKYRYYRCRRAFAGPKRDRCPSFYVNADALEDRLIEEVTNLLAQPGLVLRELISLSQTRGESDHNTAIHERLDSLERQRSRLLRLYQLGEVDDNYFERESSALKTEKDRLQTLLPKEAGESFVPPTEERLAEICLMVRTWLEHRGREELPLIARALQLSIQASKERTDVVGTIPEYAPDCHHADVRPVVMTVGCGRHSPFTSGSTRLLNVSSCATGSAIGQIRTR